MNRRWICNDVWMDTFPFFDRPQLGLKLALLSPRFDVLVDKHFNGKSELPLLRPIHIRKDENAENPKLIVHRNPVRFPLPDLPLPNKIRFNYLLICYIDHSVLAFLRSNQQIFARGTNLHLHLHLYSTKIGTNTIWDILIREIWPIFVTNIRHLFFNGRTNLDILRRLISPTILTDLNLVSIESNGLFPDVTGNEFDGPNATAGQALSHWLHTPSKDGQPKQLFYNNLPTYRTSKMTKWVHTIKKAFIRATIAAKYLIQINLFGSSSMAQFELVNERTNEKLTLKKDKGDYDFCFNWRLNRCPIGETAAGIKWKDKKLNNLINNVYFYVFRDDIYIGPLSPPAPKADQSSEKGD